MKRSGLVMAAFSLVLTSCTVTVDETSPPSRPAMCTREYRPVCAERFGERETFSNACVAQAEGFDVIHRGECRRRPPIIDPRPGEGVVCPMIHAPVCARQGGVFRTFPIPALPKRPGFMSLPMAIAETTDRRAQRPA